MKWARDAETRAERGELHHPKAVRSDTRILADALMAFRDKLVQAHRSGPNETASINAILRREQWLIRLNCSDVLHDLPGAVASLESHVGIAHPAEVMSAITEAATFASMKANAGRFTPSAGQGFRKADADFFDSAKSNKWEGQQTADDLAAYDAKVEASLSAEERNWLEWRGAPLQ